MLILIVFSSVQVERNVQEAIRVAHVHLQPVDWGVQLHLHALADDGHLWFCDLDFFSVDILTEQCWERVKEDLSDGHSQLGLLPRFEFWVKLIHSATIFGNWFGWDSLLKLNVCVMQIAQDSDGVAFEISDWSEQVWLVNLPESLVIMFEKAIFDHLVGVDLSQVRQNFTGVSHAQKLRLFQ